jgi:hypothetical protein
MQRTLLDWVCLRIESKTEQVEAEKKNWALPLS